jgi:hypothetical protein
MHMSVSSKTWRTLTVLGFILPGLFILFARYTGIGQFMAARVVGWPVTLATFAIILGVVTFVRTHSTLVIKREKYWPYNLVALLSFFLTFGMAYAYKQGYDYIITNVVQTLMIAFMGFIGFYNLTFFLRGTRRRTPEVGVLMVVSIFVMLWMAPIGEIISPIFPIVGQWLNDIPSGGAMRGFLICVAVGMILQYVRSVLGYERAWSGGAA